MTPDQIQDDFYYGPFITQANATSYTFKLGYELEDQLPREKEKKKDCRADNVFQEGNKWLESFESLLGRAFSMSLLALLFSWFLVLPGILMSIGPILYD